MQYRAACGVFWYLSEVRVLLVLFVLLLTVSIGLRWHSRPLVAWWTPSIGTRVQFCPFLAFGCLSAWRGRGVCERTPVMRRAAAVRDWFGFLIDWITRVAFDRAGTTRRPGPRTSARACAARSCCPARGRVCTACARFWRRSRGRPRDDWARGASRRFRRSVRGPGGRPTPAAAGVGAPRSAATLSWGRREDGRSAWGWRRPPAACAPEGASIMARVNSGGPRR